MKVILMFHTCARKEEVSQLLPPPPCLEPLHLPQPLLPLSLPLLDVHLLEFRFARKSPILFLSLLRASH